MATVRDRSNDAPLDNSLDANMFPITPSDTVNLIVPVDSINVGGLGGNIVMLMPIGNVVSIAVAANSSVQVPQPVRILATGTTATPLVGIASRALRQ